MFAPVTGPLLPRPVLPGTSVHSVGLLLKEDLFHDDGHGFVAALLVVA
jgi:hypothetical protein